MLPEERGFSFQDICTIFGSAARDLGCPDNVEVRSVLYQGGNGAWQPYMRTLRVGFSDAMPNVVIKAGGLTLVSKHCRATSVGNPSAVREFIWNAAPGPSAHRDAFGEYSVHLMRAWSENGKRPYWFGQIGGASGSYEPVPRSAAFANPEHNFLAETPGEACAKWLGNPQLVTATSPTRDVRLEIADPRAFFRAMRLDNNHLVVGIGRVISGNLHMWAKLTDYSGRSHELWTQTDSEVLRAEVPGAFREISGILFDSDHFPLDRFTEHAVRPSLRGEALFPGGLSRNDPGLADALRYGESDTVEVKEWMPTAPGDKKLVELLQTVCAFANTRGGVLFIGVDKNLRPRGIHVELQKLAKADAVDPTKAKDHYVRLLRERLNDGLHPSVLPDIGWVTFAGLEICRVAVSPSSALHSVFQTGLTYIRKGANNVPANGDEIRARTSEPGLLGFAHPRV